MKSLVCIIAVVSLWNSSLSVCPSDSVTLLAVQGPQFISSPNYPGPYGAFGLRLSCSWIIRAAPEYDDVVVQIQVLNSSLEPSTGCLRDSVMVVDGTRFFHSPLTSWCGTKFPKNPFVSSGPSAFIKFSTDFDNNDYTGFILAFWVAKKPKLIVNRQPWTTVNYVLFGISIVLISSLIGCFIILGLTQSWQYYKQNIQIPEQKKCV